MIQLNVSFKTLLLDPLSSRCAPCRGICKHLQVKSHEQTHPKAFSLQAALHLPAEKSSEQSTSLFEVQQVAVKEVLSVTWNRKQLLDLKGRVQREKSGVFVCF